MTQKRPKWDRLKNEPQNAFDAFVIFLELGPSRSIQKVAEGSRLELNTLYRYAAQYKWRPRAREFDDEKGDALLEQLIDERKVMAAENNKLARIMKQKVIRFLVGDKNTKPFEFRELKPSEAARLAPQWVKALAELELEAKDMQTYDLEFAEMVRLLSEKIASLEEKNG